MLTSLGINRVTIVGHSMGGMLATRFALTFPEMTEQLVSVNPLGLEDGRAKGVPWSSVDEILQGRAQHHRRQRAGISAHRLLRRHLEAGI